MQICVPLVYVSIVCEHKGVFVRISSAPWQLRHKKTLSDPFFIISLSVRKTVSDAEFAGLRFSASRKIKALSSGCHRIKQCLKITALFAKREDKFFVLRWKCDIFVSSSFVLSLSLFSQFFAVELEKIPMSKECVLLV